MEIDVARCMRCGACASVCPLNLIEITELQVRVEDGCTDCGTCARVCPVGAIQVGREV